MAIMPSDVWIVSILERIFLEIHSLWHEGYHSTLNSLSLIFLSSDVHCVHGRGSGLLSDFRRILATDV